MRGLWIVQSATMPRIWLPKSFPTSGKCQCRRVRAWSPIKTNGNKNRNVWNRRGLASSRTSPNREFESMNCSEWSVEMISAWVFGYFWHHCEIEHVPHIRQIHVHCVPIGKILDHAFHETTKAAIAHRFVIKYNQKRRDQITHALHVAYLQVLPHITANDNRTYQITVWNMNLNVKLVMRISDETLVSSLHSVHLRANNITQFV